jgi:hypothetical protein
MHEIVTKMIDGVEHAALEGKCVFTGKVYSTAYVAKAKLLEGMRKWNGGVLIQTAMPFFNADDREFVISGISPHSDFFAVKGGR